MNRYSLLPIITLAILLVMSCGRKKEKDDSISFRIVNMEKSIVDSMYYQIDIQYPQFVADDTATYSFKTLNQAMTTFLDTAHFYYWGASFDDIRHIIDETETHGVFMFHNRYHINDSTPENISLIFESYSFALGAHGFTAITTFNFDLVENRMLALTDFVDLSSEEHVALLNQLLLDNFENPQGCFIDIPTADAHFQRFGVTPDALVFYYEAYELGAYSCGSAMVLVPVDDLKEAGLWIRNNDSQVAGL